MSADRGRKAGADGEGGEFGGTEGGFDGNGAVVDHKTVPAEEPAGGGQEVVGEGMALEVLNDDGPTSAKGHVPEQVDNLGVGEVVQEERAVNDVEAGGAEGQGKGIGLDAGRRGVAEVAGLPVEAGDAGVGIGLANGAGLVAGGGADIEEGEGVAWGVEFGETLPHDAMAAEPTIQPGELAEILVGLPIGSVVQEFALEDAPAAGMNQAGTSMAPSR